MTDELPWPFAGRVAGLIAGEYDLAGSYHFDRLADTLPGVVASASAMVTEATGLELPGAPAVAVVSRREWVDRNIGGYTKLVGDALPAFRSDEATPAEAISRRLVVTEVGALLAETFAEKEQTGQRLPLSVIVLDELNKYAPRDGHSPIKDTLLDRNRRRLAGYFFHSPEKEVAAILGHHRLLRGGSRQRLVLGTGADLCRRHRHGGNELRDRRLRHGSERRDRRTRAVGPYRALEDRRKPHFSARKDSGQPWFDRVPDFYVWPRYPQVSPPHPRQYRPHHPAVD